MIYDDCKFSIDECCDALHRLNAIVPVAFMAFGSAVVKLDDLKVLDDQSLDTLCNLGNESGLQMTSMTNDTDRLRYFQFTGKGDDQRSLLYFLKNVTRTNDEKKNTEEYHRSYGR